MKNTFKLFWLKTSKFILKPFLRSKKEFKSDIYASKMLRKFNALHRVIFSRFFSKTKTDEMSLDNLKKNMESGIPVYVTVNIGQLEYNYFNYLFLEENIPLVNYASNLSNWFWMPFNQIRTLKLKRLEEKIRNGGRLPNPVSSGHIKNLLLNEKSLLISLKSTNIYNDLYWDIPSEDIMQELIRTQRDSEKPLLLFPQQFLWAKRPETEKRSIIDWMFGERENPGTIRKIILFWRNYKRHAVAQFGEPLNLREFIEAHPSIDDEEMSRILKSTLLSQISKERKAITGPTLKPRSWMIEQILESETVQKIIYETANEKNKDVEDVRLLARKYAKEITADISYSYIEFGIRALRWIFNSMYNGIHYNQEGLSQIKRISRDSSIIFVPNHRSHVDYLVLSYLLYGNNIAVPHVAAGINMAFWPLGKFFRRTGAFFLRRTFGGNILYKSVFETYLGLLIREGYCQEFFIEGGRSRTGKLRAPKMGMLSMITQSMLDKAAEEVVFVPTSITYDSVVEQTSYIDESAGTPKKKERFFDLFKLRKHLKKRHGKIYVNFGSPISFTKTKDKIGPIEERQKLKVKIVETLATEIMGTLNKGAVITPSALTATSFLMEKKRGITSEQLYKNMSLIRGYLEHAGIQLSHSLLEESDQSIKGSILQLKQNGTIEIHQDFEPIYYSIPENKRADLSFQKNTMIHFLLPLAYVSTAISTALKNGKEVIEKRDLLEKINFIKGILNFEFAAHAQLINESKIENALSFLIKKEIIAYDKESQVIHISAVGALIIAKYKALIDNYLDSYKVAFSRCSRIAPNEAIEAKGLIKSMIDFGKHMLNLGQISCMDAISIPTFENAIKLFKNLGFLTEDLAADKAKNRPKYLWNRNHTAIPELQQELELFS